MSSSTWEHFSHVADMGVRGLGPTREMAFEQAALALCALVTDLGTVRAEEEVDIRCEAPDDVVFCRFRVIIRDQRLDGSAWGERIDLERHRPGVEVKGATFTGLKVRRGEEGTWVAECVVDV